MWSFGNTHHARSAYLVKTKRAAYQREVLRRIAAWPANSNSEPGVMGYALDEIQELASHTVELLAPPKR